MVETYHMLEVCILVNNSLVTSFLKWKGNIIEKKKRYGGVITGFVERFMPSESRSSRGDAPVKYTSFKNGSSKKKAKSKKK